MGILWADLTFEKIPEYLFTPNIVMYFFITYWYKMSMFYFFKNI